MECNGMECNGMECNGMECNVIIEIITRIIYLLDLVHSSIFPVT
jgi:hypothetical protein